MRLFFYFLQILYFQFTKKLGGGHRKSHVCEECNLKIWFLVPGLLCSLGRLCLPQLIRALMALPHPITLDTVFCLWWALDRHKSKLSRPAEPWFGLECRDLWTLPCCNHLLRTGDVWGRNLDASFALSPSIEYQSWRKRFCSPALTRALSGGPGSAAGKGRAKHD